MQTNIEYASGNHISKSNQHPQRPQDQLDTKEGTSKSAKLFCNTSRAKHIHYLLILKYSFGKLFDYASLMTGLGSLPMTIDQTAV